MWGDPEVTHYLGGRPFTGEEVWTRLLRYVGHWAWMGFGYWAVEEKVSGEFIGEIGYADFKRELDPSLEGIPDLGWILAARAHGKGYATEAVKPIIEWGDRNLSFAHTVCLVHPENQRSIRVAEKCGYEQPAKINYKGGPILLFTRARKKESGPQMNADER